MKHPFAALVFGSLLAISCGQVQPSSDLKRHASPNDESTNIVRVNDQGFVRYVLVSGGKGYELSCSNPVKLKKLIEATGYPFEFINSFPALMLDSEEYLRLQVQNQPRIECGTTGKKLFKIDLDNKTKYFFSDVSKPNTRLYMIGCHKLLDGMGFDIKLAKSIEASMVDDLQMLSVDDQDDINCLAGVEVGTDLTDSHDLATDFETRVGKEASFVNVNRIEFFRMSGEYRPSGECFKRSIRFQPQNHTVMISVKPIASSSGCASNLEAAQGEDLMGDIYTYSIVSVDKATVRLKFTTGNVSSFVEAAFMPMSNGQDALMIPRLDQLSFGIGTAESPVPAQVGSGTYTYVKQLRN